MEDDRRTFNHLPARILLRAAEAVEAVMEEPHILIDVPARIVRRVTEAVEVVMEYPRTLIDVPARIVHRPAAAAEAVMEEPRGFINALSPRAQARRYVSMAVVGLIHVVVIYALVTGLAPQIAKNAHRELSARVIATQPEKPKQVVKLRPPPLEKPKLNTAVAPKIQINQPAQSSISVAPANPQPAADRRAAAVGSTHTRPPYPPAARRLGQEGRVVLRLTISPQGAVVRADVVQSSGYPELDQTAQAWVIAHWRYQPAVTHGVPVTSQTMAAVRFDLNSG